MGNKRRWACLLIASICATIIGLVVDDGLIEAAEPRLAQTSPAGVADVWNTSAPESLVHMDTAAKPRRV